MSKMKIFLQKNTYIQWISVLLLILCYGFLIVLPVMLSLVGSANSDMSVVFMGVCNTGDGFRLHDFIEWLLPVMTFLVVVGRAVANDVLHDSAFKITRYESMKHWVKNVFIKMWITCGIYGMIISFSYIMLEVMLQRKNWNEVVVCVGVYFIYMIFLNTLQTICVLCTHKEEVGFLVLMMGIICGTMCGFYIPFVDKMCPFNWGMFARSSFIGGKGYSAVGSVLIMISSIWGIYNIAIRRKK